MLHLWSYYPSTLYCSLCLRLERTNTLLVLLVFSTNRAHALDLCLVAMSRYTSSKTWRSFTTPRFHQVKNLDLHAQTHWRYWTLTQSLPWDAWGRKLHQQQTTTTTTTNILNKIKRGDPGRRVIPISIDMVDFLEAFCDFGSSVNIMPRVADRTLSFPKGILKNLCVRVGTLYTPMLPRLVSTSRGRRRHFPSRTRLHKFQSNPDMNRGREPTGGTGTSKCGPSQLIWSLQFKEVKIVNLSHRLWPKRMTQLQMVDQTFRKVEGYRHGRRRLWSIHHPWKTVPQHR